MLKVTKSTDVNRQSKFLSSCSSHSGDTMEEKIDNKDDKKKRKYKHSMLGSNKYSGSVYVKRLAILFRGHLIMLLGFLDHILNIIFSYT